jgi:hypothetical protein
MNRIVSLEQCIEDIVKHTQKQEHIENQIQTIMNIADEWRFNLRPPEAFIEALKEEAQAHKSRIERIKIYISKHHGGK